MQLVVVLFLLSVGWISIVKLCLRLYGQGSEIG